ncbi:MAG: peptide chain release factor N(5)-glutamine methyltransferase [Verrucomicrobiota bacterium]
MKTLLETIQGGTEYFEKRGVESARLNMEHLAALVLGCERMQLYLDFDRPMEEAELAPLRDLVRQRGEGVPLQHLVGSVEFFGREFACDGRALVPRPETEELVRLVLERLGTGPLRALDMGTGSGVIGLTIACERGDWEVVLADLSREALALAADNLRNVGLDAAERVMLVESDLYEVVEGDFDLVVANLPYVAEGERESLSREVRFDPEAALFGGARGTELIERFVRTSLRRVRSGGLVAMEIGLGQGEWVAGAARESGFVEVGVEKDLADCERFVFARRPE